MSDLFDWTPPPKYPDAPGFKEGTTSKEAAKKMTKRAPTLRERALAELRNAWPAGMTADEVATKLGATEFAMRPRMSELKETGAIHRSDVRRPNASGLSAIVWVAAKSFGSW